MGAESFFDYGRGRDARSIFNYLVSEAEAEYGSRGYTGSIAEKAGEGFFVVTQDAKPMSYWRSEEARQQFGDGEKWGPALAAPYAEEVVKGSKDYTIKVSARTKSEAADLAREAIKNKGRSKAGTTIQVDLKAIKKVSDAGKASIKKTKLRYPAQFKVLYDLNGQTTVGQTTYANVTEAKKGVAAFAAKFVNGQTRYNPIGIVKTEGVQGYEVTASSKMPKWEITGTRKQVAVGRAIGWVFWGWASS
jgi:hypothetical protein